MFNLVSAYIFKKDKKIHTHTHEKLKYIIIIISLVMKILALKRAFDGRVF